MIAKSHIMSQMIGSVGGITYTKNRYGAIIGRTRVSPVNVNSNPLETLRTYFNAAVARWKSLSDGQRNGWEVFAAGTPWKGALGDDIKLTGQAMYIAQVSGRMFADPAHLIAGYDVAPCTPGLIATPLLDFNCCSNPDVGVIVTVTNQDPTVTIDAIVRISPPQSPSVNYWSGPYNYLDPILLEGIAPDSSDTAEFCDICENRYFFSVRAFDATNENNMSSIVCGYFDACTAVVLAKSKSPSKPSEVT